ncbi:MAG: hypothetical protein HC934_03475 [Acaryochloridaceae cyanobacterium SU_2_1]|nr:hypothetical protein [Acaryochloridaceae cyanobacterium SU_2_1]NJM95069.1 hypothetical protein [Acaryochloridaceae cyanobacterium CSU_5_19]
MVVSFRWAGLTLTAASVLASIAIVPASPARAQSAGDVVQIGGTLSDQARFLDYWNQLINLNGPPPGADTAAPSPNESLGDAAEDPQVLAKKLSKNLKASNLRLVPIIRLNGSSELQGSLSNRNKQAVTVSGVNFEVLDASGNLIQTGSAAPRPSTLGPGQTVTFKAELLTVPPDSRYQVRLTRDPFVVQGGI